jgi:hypothetical protein
MLTVEDGALNPPHFYLTHEEIDTALVAAGCPAFPQAQPSVSQPAAVTLPVLSEQTVILPQPKVAVTSNVSIPIDATGILGIFHRKTAIILIVSNLPKDVSLLLLCISTRLFLVQLGCPRPKSKK